MSFSDTPSWYVEPTEDTNEAWEEYSNRLTVLESNASKSNIYSSAQQNPPSDGHTGMLTGLNSSKSIEETFKNLGKQTAWIPGMVKTTNTVVLFAKPNGGKTLCTIAALIEQITKGNIKGSDVIYLNEDDGLIDLEQKRKILDKHGIIQVSSAIQRMSTRQLTNVLRQAAVDGELKDKLLVVDTLTKFCDLNSTEVKEFLEFCRSVNAEGGTCLLLSHANKHEDEDGWPVFKGLQDLEDNVDAMYSMRALTDRSAVKQLVHMRRGKDRGGLDPEFFFEYEKSQILGYKGMLQTFKFVDESAKEAIDKAAAAKRRIWENEDEFLFLRGVLKGAGEMSQSDILEIRQDRDMNPNAVGRDAVKRAIKALRGLAINVRMDKQANNTKWISWRDEVDRLESY